MQDKKELRTQYFKLRKALSKESVENKSFQISTNIKKMIIPSMKTIMLYVPINHEVDLLALARELFLSGKNILFPKLIDYKNIVPYIVRDYFFDFKIGAYNIPEPDTEPYHGKIDLALVPGVVFGLDGYRIGYGKGYYDRFLSQGQVEFSVGVCYNFQLMKSVPFTKNDFCLDRIICESNDIKIIKL